MLMFDVPVTGVLFVDRMNGTRGTLCSDFQTKLDNLLKTLMHSKPHFVLCLKVKQNIEQHISSV